MATFYEKAFTHTMTTNDDLSDIQANDFQPQDSPRHSRRAVLVGAAAMGAGLITGNLSADEPADQPAVCVKAFGGVGDGRADDTAAAQAAIDAAVKQGGGRVHFASGKYRITHSLTVGSADSIEVTGDGASSVLLHEMDEPCLLWPENASCRESSVRHLAIRSSVKDKSPATASIACLGGCERSFFEHLTLSSAGARMGSGIRVEKVADTTTLAHCLLWGPVYGVGIRVARGSEVRIFGGRIIGPLDPGAGLDRLGTGVHLTGNNGGVHIVTTDIIGLHTGLKVGDSGATANREIFITHATFDSSTHGIWQQDNAFVSIAGCWAASSDEDQILIDDGCPGALMTISGGTIFNGGAYGKKGAANGLVVRSGSFQLTGVAVRHNRGSGLLIGRGARDYTISGCRITDNGSAGSLGGRGYSVTGNIFARNGSAPAITQPLEGVIASNAGLELPGQTPEQGPKEPASSGEFSHE